jgi:hypothetical protein
MLFCRQSRHVFPSLLPLGNPYSQLLDRHFFFDELEDLQPETFQCSSGSSSISCSSHRHDGGDGAACHGAACNEQRDSIGRKRFSNGDSSISCTAAADAALQGAFSVYSQHCSAGQPSSAFSGGNVDAVSAAENEACASAADASSSAAGDTSCPPACADCSLQGAIAADSSDAVGTVEGRTDASGAGGSAALRLLLGEQAAARGDPASTTTAARHNASIVIIRSIITSVTTPQLLVALLSSTLPVAAGCLAASVLSTRCKHPVCGSSSSPTGSCPLRLPPRQPCHLTLHSDLAAAAAKLLLFNLACFFQPGSSIFAIRAGTSWRNHFTVLLVLLRCSHTPPQTACTLV